MSSISFITVYNPYGHHSYLPHQLFHTKIIFFPYITHNALDKITAFAVITMELNCIKQWK